MVHKMSSLTTEEYLKMLNDIRRGRTKRTLEPTESQYDPSSAFQMLTGLEIQGIDDPMMNALLKEIKGKIDQGKTINTVAEDPANPQNKVIIFSDGSRNSVPNSFFDEINRRNQLEADAEQRILAELNGERSMAGRPPEDVVQGFKPHNMYDPKTGERKYVSSYDEHLRLQDLGYTHEKPKIQDPIDIGSKMVTVAPLPQTGVGILGQSLSSQKKVIGSEAFKEQRTDRRTYDLPASPSVKEVIRDGEYAYVVKKFPNGKIEPFEVLDDEGNVIADKSKIDANPEMGEQIRDAYNKEQRGSFDDFKSVIPEAHYTGPTKDEIERTQAEREAQREAERKAEIQAEYGIAMGGGMGGALGFGERRDKLEPTIQDISEDLSKVEPGKLKESGEKAKRNLLNLNPEQKAMMGLMGLEVAGELVNYFGPARVEARERLQELERRRERGMLGVDEQQDAETMKYMTRPIRAMAEESEREQQAVMAGMGETRSAADLRRLRESRDRQMTDALSRSGQELARQQMARKEAERRELNQLQAYQQENLRNLTNRISAAATGMAQTYGANVAGQAEIQDELSPEMIERHTQLLIEREGMSPEEARKKATDLAIKRAREKTTSFFTGMKNQS